jgi:hypothetical protein
MWIRKWKSKKEQRRGEKRQKVKNLLAKKEQMFS